MPSRRKFVEQIVGGAAAAAVTGLMPSSRVLGANDRVRFGLIGAGGRGKAIFHAALRAPNTEAVAVADVFTLRLEQARRIAPAVKIYSDFRRLLDDKTIDAVLIATPQHQHALNFVPSLQAGKDVYQEKTMAFNPHFARQMKRAFEGSGRVVQVGIQSTSGPAFQQAESLATPERMGVVTALHTHHYRNAPYGGWKRPVPPDCDLQHLNWKAFEGDAPPHAFDPNRYINWRFFWDYSGGDVFENMVHQVGFWFKALNLSIPLSGTMSGANYLSPGMEVPDTMDVTLALPEKILFSWNAGFGNNYYGESGNDLLLGNQGTIVRIGDRVSYVPQTRHHERAAPMETPAPSAGGPDIVGGSQETDAHMRNFFDCVRSRKTPNCPFEIGYRSAIACQMAVAALRRGRTVHWSEELEDIV